MQKCANHQYTVWAESRSSNGNCALLGHHSATLKDGTDRFFPKRRQGIAIIRCVGSPKSSRHSYLQAMAALSTRLQLSDSEVCLSCSCDSRRSADSKFQWLRHELLIMSAVPPPPPPAVPSVAGRYVGVGRTRRDETSM